MKYGIYLTRETFNVYADGSKSRSNISQGWRRGMVYERLGSAKIGLGILKAELNEDFFAVTQVNSVTLRASRKGYYYGESSAPRWHEEHLTYHIEKYY